MSLRFSDERKRKQRALEYDFRQFWNRVEEDYFQEDVADRLPPVLESIDEKTRLYYSDLLNEVLKARDRIPYPEYYKGVL